MRNEAKEEEVGQRLERYREEAEELSLEIETVLIEVVDEDLKREFGKNLEVHAGAQHWRACVAALKLDAEGFTFTCPSGSELDSTQCVPARDLYGVARALMAEGEVHITWPEDRDLD